MRPSPFNKSSGVARTKPAAKSRMAPAAQDDDSDDDVSPVPVSLKGKFSKPQRTPIGQGDYSLACFSQEEHAGHPWGFTDILEMLRAFY